MNNFVSISEDHPGKRSLSVLANLAFLDPDEEHLALLVEGHRFGLFRRKDDFLAEGVSAVFGLAEGEAELLALGFHVQRFTPTEAANWLVERRLTPLLFMPVTGKVLA